jgi:ligand-binding SRPBCC domain-containing protein
MIKYKKHSGVYTLKTVHNLPISLSEAWEFFSNPANLPLITPPQMRFEITSDTEVKEIFSGQIITYRVSPMVGMRTNWVTEITQVKEKQYFIDEQRFGPYAMWHHRHHFEQTSSGVKMTDEITYKVPGWFIGHIANTLLVKRKLLALIEYRRKKLNEMFSS